MSKETVTRPPVSLRRRLRVAIRTFWRRYWWAVLGATGLFAFGLAVYGAEGPGLLARLNTAIRLLPLGFTGAVAEPAEPSTALKVARLLAPLVFAYATYKAVFALFGARLQDVRARLARHHVIVCGLGDQGQALTESLVGKTKVVALELDPMNLAIPRLRDEGAIVLRGDASDPEFLERAGISRARCVVALCGPDAVNAQIAANVLRVSGQRGGEPLHAFVHVADPRLYTFLIHHALAGHGARLEFFNVYERGARSFLGETSGPQTDPDGVLVVGGGQLGLALISLMARQRFVRGQAVGAALPELRLYLVDRDADARIQLLRDRYSRIDDACALTPLTSDVTTPAFDSLLEQHPELREVDSAYVCFDDDNLTVATTLNLLDQARGRFPIVARVSHRSEGIAAMLESAQSEYAESASFRPLSLAQTCREDVVLEGIRGQIARHVHATYRRGSPGGPYDVPWEQLTGEGRERNLRHAAAIAGQLEAVGYHLGPLIDWGKEPLALDAADVERMAELEHVRWSKERLEEGWRFGPERSDEERTHPDLVPWHDLPRERQDINRRLVSERPGMLAAVGIEVNRA